MSNQQFKVNKKFRASFNKRKRRELQDKYGVQSSEESSTLSEDEYGNLLDVKSENVFLNTLAKIRARKKEIYEKDGKDYFPEEEIAEKLMPNGDLKEKPIFYKDLLRKTILNKSHI